VTDQEFGASPNACGGLLGALTKLGPTSGETLLGETSLGETSLGETSLGETSLGETSLGEPTPYQISNRRKRDRLLRRINSIPSRDPLDCLSSAKAITYASIGSDERMDCWLDKQVVPSHCFAINLLKWPEVKGLARQQPGFEMNVCRPCGKRSSKVLQR
jgi:hypothetical protein